MIFSDGITEFFRRIGKEPTDTKVLPTVKAKLNYAWKEVAKAYQWRDLERYGEVTITPVYKDGTVSVTNGSRIVTGNGTAFTSAMSGRLFQTTGSWYRILSVQSDTQLTLSSPIAEDTATGLTYQIWKKWTPINTDARLILPVRSGDRFLVPFEATAYPDAIAALSVSLTTVKGSNQLTGSGFLGVVYPGDEVKLGSVRYHVKSVDSDTQITLLNYATESVTATGTISPVNPRCAIFDNTGMIVYPNTALYQQYIFPNNQAVQGYSYIKYGYDMVHDDDRTELRDEEFDPCIFDFALAEYKRTANDSNWVTDLTVAQARLNALKANAQLVVKPYHQMKSEIRPGNGRGR